MHEMSVFYNWQNTTAVSVETLTLRKLHCLDPHKMVAVPDDCTKTFEVVQNKLAEVGVSTYLEGV